MLTSVQLLVIGKKMMTQTTPIEEFHDIFGVGLVGDNFDRTIASTEPCGTLQLTVKGPLRSSPGMKVCARPENTTDTTETRCMDA